ncbi:MAG: LysE family translocator [Parvibaculaceae bacterium]
MTLSALGLFAGAILALALSPGPTAVALVARVVTHGGRSVLPFTFALWIGEALWLTIAILGLSVFLQQFGWALAAVKWAGVLFLVLMAGRMWFSFETNAGRPPPDATSCMRLFLAGLAVTFTNPKIIAFYLALLPAVMDLRRVSFSDWAALTLTLVVMLAAIDGLYIVLAETARRRVRAIGAPRLVQRCGAVAMGAAAMMIALR